MQQHVGVRSRGFGENRQGAEITIERAPGPNGALTTSIRATHRCGIEDVRIDGKPAGLAAPLWQLLASEDETSATSDDLVAVRALVQRLRNAPMVTLAGNDTVSLDGFSAAMLGINDGRRFAECRAVRNVRSRGACDIARAHLHSAAASVRSGVNRPLVGEALDQSP